jgi:hypothetical protein
VDKRIPLSVLKADWQAAKAEEDAAKAKRVDVERAMLAHFPDDKLEGTVTDKDHGISVTFKVTRKVDTDALQRDWDKLGKNGQAAFKWSADIDTKNYKALADLDPTTHAMVAAYVTTKPAKPAVTLKD